jgi:methylglutaconyl-CoA hydratase
MAGKSPGLITASSGGVTNITLNRPEKRNALNDELITELTQAIETAASDSECRVVVLKGAGPDFCAGADLAALQKIADSSIYENLRDADLLVELFLTIRKAPVPVISAVHGRALAGGCGLATACDLILATESARFGYPEVKLGFVPAIVMAILRRSMSEKRAFEVIVTGKEISAGEARELGIVNEVYPDIDFETCVADYCRSILQLSASAIALSKRLLYQIDGMNYSTALGTGAEVNAIARQTDDCKKGINSFLSRKK